MEYELKTSLLPLKETYTTLEKIFAIRGIAPDKINHLLNPTEEDVLDPFLVDNMMTGIKTLMKHIADQDNILVVVDSDCDGFTSAALFINYLNFILPGYTQNHIMYNLHSGKQHGLGDLDFNFVINNSIKMIVCPDSASNDYDRHKELSSLGIDVLVIDHHEAEYVSQDAIIINNQLCKYPTKSLSGVGMVYKFFQAFDSVFGFDNVNNFMDLVALGLSGDMMDIRDYETMYLIVEGIKNIRNPFMKEMIKIQDYSISKAGGLCPFSLSFYIVPQINGTIRMGTLKEKTFLFESMLEFKSYESIPSTKRGCKGQMETFVEQACRNCTNIKRNQSKSVDLTLGIIENIIDEKHLMDNKIIAVKLDKTQKIDRNLSGLIANQLMAKYQHPILILVETTNKEGQISWEGSARGYETSNFKNFKDFCNDSNLFSLSQGHQYAFGVAIPDTNFTQFIDYSNEVLKDCTFNPCSKVDFIWNQSDVNYEDIIKIAELKTIWGQGLEEPVIALENIRITQNNIQLMGKSGKCPTIRITLSNGVQLIKFGVSEEEFEQLIPKYDTGSITINAVGKCSYNNWNGLITPQFLIEDYNIIGEQQYYF